MSSTIIAIGRVLMVHLLICQGIIIIGFKMEDGS